MFAVTAINVCLCFALQGENIEAIIHDYMQYAGEGELRSKQAKLIAVAGAKAFPSFDKMLNDPKLDDRVVDEIFVLLVMTDADSSKYKPVAHQLLLTMTFSRRRVLTYLCKYGNQTDIAPIVALLFDKSSSIVNDSAEALVKLGGTNEAIAMKIWLKSDAFKLDDNLRKHVADCAKKIDEKVSAQQLKQKK